MFTSDVHLCLTVGGTVVRRGERPLRRHLGEITLPSKGRVPSFPVGQLILYSSGLSARVSPVLTRSRRPAAAYMYS